MSSDLRIPVDDDVKEDTEDVYSEIGDLVGGFKKEGSSGSEELDLYTSWLPGADEHKGKTRITEHQAHSLAAMINLPKVYDLLGMHIEGFDEFVESLSQDYMQLLPSVVHEGRFGKSGLEDARTQQMRVLMAKAGVHADEEQATRAMWRRMAAGEDDD